MVYDKKSFNRKKFTKEYKLKEIQKSLIKRARLKKEYLKALHEEGYSVPEKREVAVPLHKSRAERTEQNKKREQDLKTAKREKKREDHFSAEQKRQNQLLYIDSVKQKQADRARRNIKMQQKTKSGQPKMGPKIEGLLDKIKSDDIYTT